MGFNALYESRNGRDAPAVEVACWAHVRRKIFDVHEATGSPLAREALERMGALFAIERTINGQPPEERRRVRQLRAKPIIDELKSSTRACRSCPPRTRWPARSAMRAAAGRRWCAMWTTAGWR